MPLPNPFVGTVFNPAGLLVSQAMKLVAALVSGTAPLAPVLINGFPATAEAELVAGGELRRRPRNIRWNEVVSWGRAFAVVCLATLTNCRTTDFSRRSAAEAGTDVRPLAETPAELTAFTLKEVQIENAVAECVRLQPVGRRIIEGVEVMDVDLLGVQIGCGCLSSLLAYEVRDEALAENTVSPGEHKDSYLGTYGILLSPKSGIRRRISLVLRADASLSYSGTVRLQLGCAPPM